MSNLKKTASANWRTLMLATSMLGGLASNAAAQDADTGGLDEIIVTAQKREENLQDVPVSVQAIGNERLEQLQVNDINDYARFLPSLSLQTLAPGFTRTYFRGVASGENGNHSGPLPSVGTYLDEQPITTITGLADRRRPHDLRHLVYRLPPGRRQPQRHAAALRIRFSN